MNQLEVPAGVLAMAGKAVLLLHINHGMMIALLQFQTHLDFFVTGNTLLIVKACPEGMAFEAIGHPLQRRMGLGELTRRNLRPAWPGIPKDNCTGKNY